jgi:hypothetical protein
MSYKLLATISLLLLVSNCISQSQNIIYKKIEIVGSKEFESATKNALNLLDKTKESSIIREHIGRIRESPKSGMREDEDVPTFEVSYAEWNYSSIWYAGVIAHDSCHSNLYFDAKKTNGGAEPPQDAWTGRGAEQKCLDFQLTILEELGADDYTMQYVGKLRENPTYQDVSYNSRSW